MATEILTKIIIILITTCIAGLILYIYINKAVTNHNNKIREPIPGRNTNTNQYKNVNNKNPNLIEELNDFNNIQQNKRVEDLIYYIRKILFWIRLIGIYFVILPMATIIIAIMLIINK